MKRRSSRDVTKEPEPKEREVWSSRLAFYFASIGAAVGFGNVWRFPGLSVEYGGGAFFVPYLLALALIGIPLAILEIGFGQYFQTGDIGVFGKRSKRENARSNLDPKSYADEEAPCRSAPALTKNLLMSLFDTQAVSTLDYAASGSPVSRVASF